MTDDTDNSDEQDSTTNESTDGVWVFRLRPGITSVKWPRTTDPAIPTFGRRNGEQAYRIIDDSDVAEALKSKEDRHGPVFLWMDAEDVDAALSSAKEAVNAIESGEYDDVLHFLLIAERRHYGPRVTVIEAIASRNATLREQRAEDDGGRPTIRPNDIVSAG